MKYSFAFSSCPRNFRDYLTGLTLLIFLSYASAFAQICATPGKDGNATGTNALGFGGTSVVVNTYYPATSNASSGSTSINVGTPRGSATAITAGDLLLVIQIQDSNINRSNSNSYGDGVSGGDANGATNDRNTGLHEYVQATGPVSGGSVPIQGATAGSGLINTYRNSNATGSRGQRRFQVIRVPQYADCEIVGTVEAEHWNGSTGGIVAMDVDGTLTFFSGSEVNVTGQGFRGGGARQLFGGGGGSNTDYRTNSSNNYNGSKGEGTAGTPRYVHQSFTGTQPPGQVINTGAEGYPNGSYGRGAPGNAGGGGTDGNTSANDQNSGGGGGGNGGDGGRGGNSWSSNLAVGGYGGGAFGAATIQRLVLGGGGGAATRNNSANVQGSGGAGGGLVMIRAATITGTGTIEANGIEPNAANGLLPANDGGGGGGAGGTLVVFGNAGSLANIALLANGGKGGDCALIDPNHGPGGGGGGGLIYVNDLLTGTVSTNGGANGITSSPAIAYGATSGSGGSSFLNAQITTLEPCGFVPVSLGYFKANWDKNQRIQFEWMTATEAGNLGFDLFGYDGQDWIRLNHQLIPSKAIDSDKPIHYEFSIPAGNFKRFTIEDIDRFGKKNRHGSFDLGTSYGHKTHLEQVPWPVIAREHERANIARKAVSSNMPPEAKLQVIIRQKGMYRLTYEDIVSKNPQFDGIPLGDLAMTRKNMPVPIRVSTSDKSASEGVFGPGWVLDFFGEPEFSLYTDTTLYHLVANQRMATRITSSAPSSAFVPFVNETYTARFERRQDENYSFASPLTDPWFDSQLLALEEPASFEYSFDIANHTPGTLGQLHIEGYGVTDFPADTDHHLRLYLNQVYLGEWYGNGLEVLSHTFDIAPYLLREGSNTLRIDLPADLGLAADVFHLEAFTVSYEAGLKTTNNRVQFEGDQGFYQVKLENSNLPLAYAATAQHVYHLTNLRINENKDGSIATILVHPNPREGLASFFLSQDQKLLIPELRLPIPHVDILGGKTDYLIISHPNFIPGLGPFVQAKSQQGFRVQVVDVEQIYREFSDSQVDADAIAAYIAYAKDRMNTRYVLLVGGDSYDYKNFLNLGSMSFIPTRYVRTGAIVGHAPSDASLADTDDDGISDVAIGRFPVRTLEELSYMINKTLHFKDAQHSFDSLFVAGSDENSISFTGFSDYLQTFLPAEWGRNRAYIDDLGVANTRDKLTQTLNQGLAFLNFFGHSGPTVWTFENLFSADQAGQLQNYQAPALVTQWGCWNTYFVAPAYNTMAHKFLLSGNQGAAAVIGASTLTSVSSEKPFAPKFFQQLFQPGQTLGEALLRAKQETMDSYPDLKDIYLGIHLLGDPAMVLNP